MKLLKNKAPPAPRYIYQATYWRAAGLPLRGAKRKYARSGDDETRPKSGTQNVGQSTNDIAGGGGCESQKSAT